MRGLACEDVWEIGNLGPEVAYQTAINAMHPDADAIVIGETSFRTKEIIEPLESDSGKPVVAASIVSMWNAVRLAGVREPLSGLGALFRVVA
jgi:maleate cis-trans isomerase